MEYLGRRNKSRHFPFSHFPLLPSNPPPAYIFSFPLIRRSELAPSTTSNDLFYYLVDLVAATVYWNPRRRSEIMRRTTRPDARLLPRSRYETANYRGRDELSKHETRKKKKERKKSVPRISFLFATE